MAAFKQRNSFAHDSPSKMAIESKKSYRPARFQYVTVNNDFLDDLLENVERGESAALFGPRGFGKQQVIAEIQKRLKARNSSDVFVHLRLESLPQSSVDALLKLVSEQLSKEIPEGSWSGIGTFYALSITLREFLETRPTNVVFLVSNIDALPDFVARQLLRMFRELTHLRQESPGRLAVLLTGAVEMGSLVYGANSEFTVTNQFVVQEIAEDVFSRYFEQLINVMGPNFESGCEHRIRIATNGNLLLSRVVIDALVYQRRLNNSLTLETVQVEEIDRVLVEIGNTHSISVFRDVLLQSFAQIDESVPSLCALEELLLRNFSSVGTAMEAGSTDENAPTLVELCGFARRERNRLLWASYVVESFAHSVFSSWSLGDAFASCNSWEKALNCYERAKDQWLPWIATPSHRPRLRTAIRMFETMLTVMLSDPLISSPSLRCRLTVAAEYLLGFDTVTYWRSDPTDETNKQVRWREMASQEILGDKPAFNDTGWGQQFLRLHQIGERNRTKDKSRRQALIETTTSVKCGANVLDESDSPFAILIGLPDDKERVVECVLLDNFSSETPLTRLRTGLSDSVVRSFVNAFQQVSKNQKAIREANHHRYILKAIPDFFRIIGGGNDHVGLALNDVGNAMRRIGYRRIMFSLVDFGKDRIRGVVDCRPEGEPDIAELTDFPLPHASSGEYADVHTACVVEGKTYNIQDARYHPLTAKDTVHKADLRAIAVIPLKHHGQVIGTVHVEKDDKSALSPSELKQLEAEFADQLTSAITAGLRIEMLENALQEQTNAIVVVDHANRIRFLNKSANRLLNCRSGWYEKEPLSDADEFLTDEVCKLAMKSIKSGGPVSRNLTKSFARQSMSALHVSPLKDWRDVVIGAVIQIQDMSGLSGLLRALKELATSNDIDSLSYKLLIAAQNLGHSWGRLYLLNRESQLLVGQAQFGLPENTEGAQAFLNHTAILPARGEAVNTWLCFDHKAPVMLRHTNSQVTAQIQTTYDGLTVVDIVDEDFPTFLRKQVGALWMDLPLYSRDDGRELGKLSLDVPSGFSLAGFEIRSILAEAVSAALTAIGARERREAEEANRQRSRMLEAIGITCHNLASKLAAFETLGMRFDAAKSQEELHRLKLIWNERLRAVQRTLNDTKLRLRPIEIVLKDSSPIRLMTSILEEQMASDQFQINSECPEFSCPIDTDRMKEAIEELLSNARKSVANANELFIDVHISQFFYSDRQMCRIEITDNGNGIPVDRRERIFDPWFSEWREGQPRGTGLGLSFVKTVFVAHRGTVRVVEPRIGKGACFQIEIPVAKSVPLNSQRQKLIGREGK